MRFQKQENESKEKNFLTRRLDPLEYYTTIKQTERKSKRISCSPDLCSSIALYKMASAKNSLRSFFGHCQSTQVCFIILKLKTTNLCMPLFFFFLTK